LVPEVALPKLTAQQLKEHNQQLVLNAIYSGEATSRVAIARATSLTRPTVSQIVAELLELGLVHEAGPGESSGGKPPTLLNFTDDAFQIIALHLGGRLTVGLVTDLRGRITTRASQPINRRDSDSIIGGLCAVLEELRRETTRPLLGIGISAPGLVDHHTGVVRYSTHLNWHDIPVVERLAECCAGDVPIYLENDTNLAALGERVFGVGDGVDNLVIVMVGSRGVGAGLIVNGEIYHGSIGGAGEIGHSPVAGNSVACMCGRRGCLEAVSSGWALIGRASRAGLDYPGSHTRLGSPNGFTIDDLSAAVAVGEPAAEALAREAGHYLGLAVATLISTLNPQRVIIGGSVAALGKPLFDSLQCTVSEHTLGLLAEATEIFPASLGNDAYTLGAVAQVLGNELGVV
jgi:glucokinase-like ROK family protein